MNIRSNSAGILLVLNGILIACNIYSLIPLYNSIGNEVGIATSEVAYGSTIFTIFYAFGLLTFGPISDRYGRKPILVYGMFLASLTTMLVAFATSPLQLYIFRGVQGFFLASFAPVAFSYSFDIFQEKSRTFWIALINAGFLAAGIIGQLISSILNAYFSWQSVYIAFSLVYLLLFVSSSVVLPKTVVPKTNEKMKEIFTTMANLLRDKGLKNLYLIVAPLLFSFVAFYESLSYSLIPLDGNIIFVRGAGLIGACLAIFTGSIIKIWSEVKTLIIGIALGWCSLFLLLFTKSLVQISITSILLVAAFALIIPTIISLIGKYSGIYRGKALSLYSFILLTGAGIAPLVASLFSYKMMLAFLLLVFSFKLIVSFKLSKKEPQQQA